MSVQIRVTAFGGEVPKRGARLLKEHESQYAVNCSLGSGEIQPLHAPEWFHTFPCDPMEATVRYAFKMPAFEDQPEEWIPFLKEDVSFVKGPLTRDIWERYYWTHDSKDPDNPAPVSYGSRRSLSAEIEDSCDATGFRLGVPKPTRPPAVTSAALAHPLSIPHYEVNDNNLLFNTETFPAGGALEVNEWILASGDQWNRVDNLTGSTYVGFMSSNFPIIGRYDDLPTVPSVIKNSYAMVRADPQNPDRNVWYIATEDGQDLSYEIEDPNDPNALITVTVIGGLTKDKWRFTGGDKLFRPFDDTTGPQPGPEDDEFEAQAKVIVWEGGDINGMHDNISSTAIPPPATTPWPQFNDYIFADTPSTFLGEDDVWGWFLIHGDPQLSTSSTIRKVNPGSRSEIVTRAYVYTFVNAFGEEGPPSDPVEYSGLDGENWVIYNLDYESIQADDYLAGPDNRAPITSVRLYRTVTGTSGGADFFFVGELPITTNMASFTSIAFPEAFDAPKWYERETASSIYTATKVRHGDWMKVTFAEGKPYHAFGVGLFELEPAFRYDRWFKAIVRDADNNIDYFTPADDKYIHGQPQTVPTYEWVEQQGTFGSNFFDDVGTDIVAQNDALEAYSWFEPPLGLKGLTAHPDGFLVGFKGRELFTSVPYRPHAWPEEYILTVQHPIVGVGIYGSSIAILTEGHPYVAAGTRPEALALTKHERPVPCTSLRGITSILGGVLFPSRDGLYIVSDSGVASITSDLMTETQWQAHNPEQVTITQQGNNIVAFYDTDKDFLGANTGFKLSPDTALESFSHLRGSSATCPMCDVDNIQTDTHTGRCFIIQDNQLYWFDPPSTAPIEWTWRSKFFTVPYPTNFGAMDLGWRKASYVIHADPIYAGDQLFFRLYPDSLDPADPTAQARSTELDLGKRAALQPTLTVPQGVIRLPAGYKSNSFWFQLRGTSVVEYINLAETGAGLRLV